MTAEELDIQVNSRYAESIAPVKEGLGYIFGADTEEEFNRRVDECDNPRLYLASTEIIGRRIELQREERKNEMGRKMLDLVKELYSFGPKPTNERFGFASHMRAWGEEFGMEVLITIKEKP